MSKYGHVVLYYCPLLGPGRNFRPLLLRLLSEHPEEIAKLRLGKKMRRVKAFFLGKLQEQLSYVDTSFANAAIHQALEEAV